MFVYLFAVLVIIFWTYIGVKFTDLERQNDEIAFRHAQEKANQRRRQYRDFLDTRHEVPAPTKELTMFGRVK